MFFNASSGWDGALKTTNIMTYLLQMCAYIHTLVNIGLRQSVVSLYCSTVERYVAKTINYHAIDQVHRLYQEEIV